MAISIPIFTAQLEKAREATDAANIRSKYAEITTAYLTDDAPAAITGGYEVTLKQKKAGWDSPIDLPEGMHTSGEPTPGKKASLTCDVDGTVYCTFGS